MNDRFLSRGKRKDNGEWVEGYYLSQNKVVISYFEKGEYDSDEDLTNCKCVVHRVLPKTVGGCTGKKDKNGRMVFEGDILRVKKFNDDPVIGKVVFNENTAGFEVWWNIVVGAYGEKATRKENFAVCGQMEVIGNIYDTPELLK
ncbi:MAG: YopX family protein [Oscillospiraceae bacterium]|nr:YopX family protein [Oscillospiraceae bacterium]